MPEALPAPGELTCGCSGPGRAQPRSSHPGSLSLRARGGEAGEGGPW